MTSRAATGNEGDDRLAAALDAYLAAREAGRPLDSAELLAKNPEIADDLAACLASLHFLNSAELRAGEPKEKSNGSRLTSPQPALGTLGDFRLLREIGRGGMGVVYEAEQLSLRRRVALKILPLAGALDKRQLVRFQNEATSAASLHHPHVAPIYGIGSERGIHFYAMQLIQGVTLAEVISYLRDQRSGANNTENPLGLAADSTASLYPGNSSTQRGVVDIEGPASSLSSHNPAAYYRRVAELMADAAAALDYAHAHGIVHRDIKPSNLMLDDDGKIWVMDFGLASMGATPQLTMTGDVLGTLRYTSPEQAAGERAILDQRTDVYSLGTTLYELLTLQPAHEGTSRAALLKQVMHDEPTRPRRIAREIPAELEVIALKAMAKAPSDRYASAAALAEDLRRFRDLRPIQARPISAVARGWRWALRNPDRAGIAALGLVLLSMVLVGGLWIRQIREAARRETGLKDQALAAEKKTVALKEQAIAAEKGKVKLQEFYVALARIRDRSYHRPTGWVWENREDIRRIATDAPDEESRQALRSELALACASHDLRRVATLFENCDAFGAVWNRDGTLLAVGENTTIDDSIVVHLFSAPSWKHQRLTCRNELTVPATADQPEGIRSLAFNSDSTRLLAGTRHGKVLVFNLERRRLQSQWPAHEDKVCGLLLRDNGWLLTAAEDASFKIWNFVDQKRLYDAKFDSARSNVSLCEGGGYLYAFAAPTEKIALADEPPYCRVVRTVDLRCDKITVTPDEDGILGAKTSDVAIYDQFQGGVVRRFFDPRRPSAHEGRVSDLDVSPAGQWVVSTADGTLHLWDFLSGRPLGTALLGGRTHVEAAFHPQDDTLCVTGDGKIFVFEVHADPCFSSVLPQSYWISNIDLTPSGRTLVATAHTERKYRDDKAQASRVYFLDEPWTGEPTVHEFNRCYGGALAVDSGGRIAASRDLYKDEILVLPRKREEEAVSLHHVAGCTHIEFSSREQRLWYTAHAPEGTLPGARREPSSLVVVDAADPKSIVGTWINSDSQKRLRLSSFSDLVVGKEIAVATSEDQALRVFDQGAELLKRFTLRADFPDAVALSDDENWAVVGTRQGHLLVFDLKSGTSTRIEAAHAAQITDLALSKTDLLVSGCKNGEIRFWQFTEGQLTPLFRLVAWTSPVRRLCISDDGHLLAALLKEEGGVRLIHLDQLRALMREYGLGW